MGLHMVSLTLIGSDVRAVRPSRLRALTERREQMRENLRTLRTDGAISGGLLISTCNRVEALLHTNDHAPSWVWTERLLGFQPDFPIRALEGTDSVDHLLRVTAGLESMVLGEAEILGQVRRAFEESEELGLMSKPMHRLRTRLLSAARTLRANSGLTHRAKSVASLGANRLVQAGPRLAVVGAGDTARLALEALRRRGIEHPLVINRTVAKAEQLAQEFGGQALSLDEFRNACPELDGVLLAVHSPQPIVDAAMAERIKLLIDVSQPSVVAPEIRRSETTEVLDLDDLATIAEREAAELRDHAERGRAQARQQAERIWRDLVAERAHFGGIVDLHTEHAIGELEKTLRGNLSHLDDDSRDQVRKMIERIAKRNAHFHIRDLKELTST